MARLIDPRPIDYYDGESGALLLQMSRVAAEDCSTPRQAADESVKHYRDNPKHVRWPQCNCETHS